MKDTKYKELISCAVAFISFVLPKIEVDEIILFGSVARGEADKESDIDIFFNVKRDEDKIKDIAKRNKIIRELFGREEKIYIKKGMIETLGGKKLSPSSFIVPIEKANEIFIFLNKEKAKYNLFEFWTDEF